VIDDVQFFLRKYSRAAVLASLCSCWIPSTVWRGPLQDSTTGFVRERCSEQKLRAYRSVPEMR
jgi:hypothetical protein